MSRDYRASQIDNYLRAGKMSLDACRCLAYAIERLEVEGELEMLISEEIDAYRGSSKESL